MENMNVVNIKKETYCCMWIMREEDRDGDDVEYGWLEEDKYRRFS
jgi:hypothetical protein